MYIYEYICIYVYDNMWSYTTEDEAAASVRSHTNHTRTNDDAHIRIYRYIYIYLAIFACRSI